MKNYPANGNYPLRGLDITKLHNSTCFNLKMRLTERCSLSQKSRKENYVPLCAGEIINITLDFDEIKSIFSPLAKDFRDFRDFFDKKKFNARIENGTITSVYIMPEHSVNSSIDNIL